MGKGLKFEVKHFSEVVLCISLLFFGTFFFGFSGDPGGPKLSGEPPNPDLEVPKYALIPPHRQLHQPGARA